MEKLCVTSQTRSDMSNETYAINNTWKHPSIKMFHEVNKTWSKLESKKEKKIPDLGNPKNV